MGKKTAVKMAGQSFFNIYAAMIYKHIAAVIALGGCRAKGGGGSECVSHYYEWRDTQRKKMMIKMKENARAD
jgi:hypothetical protein